VLGLLFLVVHGIICNEMKIFPKHKLNCGYNYSDKVRTFRELPLTYRTIQVLLRTGMCLYGKFFVPVQAMMGQTIVISSYLLISQKKSLELLDIFILFSGIIFAMCFWGFVLILGGIVFRESKKTVLSWKWNGRWKLKKDAAIMKKFGRSCQPICIGFPGYFKVTHITFLNFLRAVVQNIVGLLLALK
jgi:hypothetical protein